MAKSQSSKRERRSVREESRAVYRRAIFEAAMRVFGRTGFRESKIADIAAEAGVATGTLYNYFSSKEDIFKSILDDGRERLSADIDEQVRIEDPILRLREVIRAMFGFLEDQGALFMVYLQLGANPLNHKSAGDELDEAFRERILQLLITCIAEAGERVRTDIPTEALAWSLGGLINGAILRWLEDGCNPGLRDATDTIMDLFLNGAAPR